MKYFVCVFFLIPFSGIAQNVSGYLYNNEAVIPNFPILNTRTNTYFKTAKTGYFEVKAQVGDTLQFKSIAYQTQILVIQPKHFTHEIVVELTVTELDEVQLHAYKEKELDVANLDTVVAYSIQKDIEKHPWRYKPSGGNILAAIKLVAGIFKKKDKDSKEEKAPELLTYTDFQQLFKTDSFFNKAYLEENLELAPQYHQLFFNYLATKKITSDLLNDKKQLEFIEKLIIAKTEFVQNLDEFSSEK